MSYFCVEYEFLMKRIDHRSCIFLIVNRAREVSLIPLNE